MLQKYFIIIIVLVLFSYSVKSQVLSVSPGRYTLNISPNAQIQVTFNTPMNVSSFIDTVSFLVNGTSSRRIKGTFSFNGDNTIVTFSPITPFRKGERIIVDLTNKIKTSTNANLIPYIFQFNIQCNRATAIFSEVSDYPINNNIQLGVGDFDKNSTLDIVVGSGQIYLNDGNNFYQSSNLGSGAISIVTLDLEGDNDLDLVFGTGTILRIYSNNGTAIFTYVYPLSLGSNITDLVSGDWDGDGDIDVAAISNSGSKVFIVKNDGFGNFTLTQTITLGNAPNAITSGDWDGDGDIDIVTVNTSTITVLKNLNDGNFSQTGSISLSGKCVTSGDFDNDGKLDFAVVNSGSIKIMKNDGGGNFTNISTISVNVNSISSNDLDGDGDLDIIGISISGTIPIIFNNGNNNFTVGSTLAVGSSFADPIIKTEDFDNDGDIDIVAITPNTQYSFSIFKNKNYSTVSGNIFNDFNGNGFRDLGESGLANWKIKLAGTYTDSVSSDENGEYIFPSVLTGEYVLSEALKPNWVQTFPSSGTYSFSVTLGVNISGKDFGNYQSIPPSPPHIASVKDVPNDQGGKVTILWNASALDTNIYRLPYYSIWRAIPQLLKNSIPYISLNEMTKDFDGKAYTSTEQNGIKYVWEWLANQPALLAPSYMYNAGTLFDSTINSNGKHYFLVYAHTSNANIFFPSNVDSGHSVDNLGPNAPGNLTANVISGDVQLHWKKNLENDLYSYLLYRSSSPNINTDSIEAFASTTDTIYIDNNPLPFPTSYYILRAQDTHGNFSQNSNEVMANITSVQNDEAIIPITFALYQNYPNPFNPRTEFRFDIPKQSFVVLKVYDIFGREIAALVNEQKTAGTYFVTWDASNTPSGVYFYRLNINSGEFVITKEMMLVK
ncbi:MAG: FG-GAP-like repeat-containing protein [Bacteroidota bacterium]